MNLNEIKTRYIEELIPNILYKKLIKHNIDTIGQIQNLSDIEFSKYPYVGNKVIILFSRLKQQIQDEPEVFISLAERNEPKAIPNNYFESSNLLDIIRDIIEDFLEHKENYSFKTKSARQRHLRDIDIVRKAYGLKSKVYERDKIA